MNHGSVTPWFIVALASLFLVLGNAALLAFPSAVRRRDDRVRFAVDALIVVVGSLLTVWILAIEPFLRAADTIHVRDYVYTIGDSLAVVLSAVLYLRSGRRVTRTAAAYLLLAHTLLVVPDILFSARFGVEYRPGHPVELIWFSVWVVKWIGARWALVQLATDREGAVAPSREYRSGFLPTVFLAVASGAMLLELTSGTHGDSGLFLLGSAMLAALLVGRQLVELREGERLRGRIVVESAWFSAVLEHAYDFLALVDRHGRTMFLSPGTLRVLGIGDLPATPWALLDAVHAEDAPALRALLSAPDFDSANVDARVLAADGEWHQFSLRLQDLRRDPTVGAVVVDGHDVSREAQLEQRIRAGADVEALGVFAGGLAHDLNNFLTVITAHVDLLLDEVSPARATAFADLRAIKSAATRTATLTNGLLTLTRRKTSARETVDLGELVRQRLVAAAVRSEIACTGGPFTVRADPLALRHAVDALIHDQLADDPFAGQPDAGRPWVGLSTIQLTPARAEALALSSGPYVVLAIGGRDPAPRATPRRTRAVARSVDRWEDAPDDLGALLVHAAARELGGAVAVEHTGSVVRMVMYVPGAG